MFINESRLRLNPVSVAIFMFVSAGVQADDYYFPRSLISDAGSIADMSVFEKQQGQLPGDYQVDIFVNQKIVATSQVVHFVSVERSINDYVNSTGLRACLSRDWYSSQGILLNEKSTSDSTRSDNFCINVTDYIPQASEEFDFQTMKLSISVPQAAMKTTARDAVSPESWDEGINAVMLSYRLSGDSSRSDGYHSSSQFLNLDSGINVGPWRLRDNSVYSRYSSSNTNHEWKHVKTYAERAIIPWRSRLIMGETATTGDIFDSVDFRGVQLSTDDDMYPDSLKGFAPVIRGIALSHSKVTISQNGYDIYKTYVSPGPFEIRDLYSMASSGDLTVVVSEADGQIRQFTVPYSSVPVLQRPGHQRYSLTAGSLRSGDNYSDSPSFTEVSWVGGFDNNVTAYGGMQIAEHYNAVSFGTGMNMGVLGAISADITQSRSRLNDGSSHQGQSLRFLYAHAFNQLGTTFQLMGYRYSTKGFYTLEESARKSMTGREGPEPVKNTLEYKEDTRPYYNLNNTRRQRLVANISQAVGHLGSIYLTGTHQSYWNTGKASTSWQAGYSSAIWGASYSISWGYTREPGVKESDRTFGLSISVPLDRLMSGSNSHSIYATTNYTRSSSHNSQIQEGLNGTALERDNLNWNLSVGRNRSDRSKQDSGNVSLNYQGGYGNISTGYSYSQHDRQINYGLSGAIALHENGLTLSQPLGETNILVAAPGASRIDVDNQTGIHTDWRGYTVVPYATIYQHNRVSLNTLTLDNNTELDGSVKDVVPTRGALVRADFQVRTGYRVMMTLLNKGKPLPFGTVVTIEGNGSIVGDDGQVYLSGLAEKDTLKASWGNSPEEQCTARYSIPTNQLKESIIVFNQTCQ